MEQTILQRPMQPLETPTLQERIGVIYHQPVVPPVLPVAAGLDLELTNEVTALQELTDITMPTVKITKRRRQILEALNICQDLTVDQLQEMLRLSPASIPYLREHLRVLEREKFVEASAPAKQTFYGRAPNVYSNGTEARKYLRRNGTDVPTRYKPLKERLHEEYPIRHTLAVNDVYIKAKNLRFVVPDVRLKDFVHEKDLNAYPLKIALPQREKLYGLSPDLWLSFTHPLWDFFTCVELNMSKVGQRDWRERVRAYLYSLSAYRERFGTNALVVLIIVQSKIDFPKTNVAELTPEETAEWEDAKDNRRQRVENMVKWTAAELKELNAQQHADMFLFTDLRLHDMSPQELFFGSHWRIPNRSGTYAPLPPHGREAGGG